MGTSAVAINELFIGLSVEITNSGVTNLRENAAESRPVPDWPAYEDSCLPASISLDDVIVDDSSVSHDRPRVDRASLTRVGVQHI
jgi:hypothetical protein